MTRSCVPLTSLGKGHLWMLFDAGALSFLFTRTLVTLEQWPAWARQPQTWRVRKLGEGFSTEDAAALEAMPKAKPRRRFEELLDLPAMRDARLKYEAWWAKHEGVSDTWA